MAVMASENGTEKRLDDLSLRVESIDRRMESGFAEIREEFRAIRGETKGDSHAIRGEMKSEFQAMRGEMKAEFRAVRAEMTAEFQALRGEMAAQAAMLNQTIHRLFGGMLVAWVVGVIAIIAQAN
ncbi:MAG TPA: hypothetical protein VFN92_06340 [Solirubrobacterales bacterium]|nr:hypothetical protein [Solirubrobacterales bacterium]